MLCFKDRTYCPFWISCNKGEKCDRALTQEVINIANEVELPISQFVEEPRCYEPKRSSS